MSSEPGPTLTRGLVVSDLHLFARRSEGAAFLTSLENKLAATDVFVLNGDTFDFRWIAPTDREKAFAAATDDLRTLLHRHPQCTIHFILGNHDCLLGFQRALTELAATQPRFQWHPWLLRLGSAMFLHGDCAEASMDAAELQRRRAPWEHGQQRGRIASWAYRTAEGLGLAQQAHEWFFPRPRVVERIAHYLDHVCPGWRGEVRDCYFGHTHLPFSGHTYEGIAFHNTGSAMPPILGFNPLSFEVQLPHPSPSS